MHHRLRTSPRQKPRQRGGFTLVELLVTVGIISVLVSILLPAVLMARESSRKSQCQNNLRQLGLAMHDHGTNFNRLPALGCMGFDSNKSVTTFFGWTVRILPHLEQGDLYRTWDFNKPYSDPGNQIAAAYSIPVFQCPSDTTTEGERDLSYVANGGFGWTIAQSGAIDCAISYPLLNPIDLNGNGTRCPPPPGTDGSPTDRELLIRTGVFFLESWNTKGVDRHHTLDTFVDGMTYTILLAENIRTGYDPFDTTASWASADALRMGFFMPSDVCNGGSCADANVSQGVANSTHGINSGLEEAEGQSPWPSSQHLQGVNVCMADGSVRFLSENISSTIYYALVTSQGSLFKGALADSSAGMNGF